MQEFSELSEACMVTHVYDGYVHLAARARMHACASQSVLMLPCMRAHAHYVTTAHAHTRASEVCAHLH